MSKKDFKRTLVTAALPYANGPLHIGHIAGAYLPSDLYCRYKRMTGEDVLFVCGSDEHGVPIMLKGRSEGISPQEVADRYHAMIKKSFADLGMSFDHYGRTSAKIHHETSQDFFRKLAGQNDFVIKRDEQLYDPEAELFLADRFVKGTCPNCNYAEAYGDQCESCGTALSPNELINPVSTITDATPIMKETAHWYLPLGDWQPKLEKWIGDHPEWKPNVTGQIKSWFNAGLTDRAMTRDIPWGIQIPEDVAKAAGTDAKGKVLYVWFDAPIGYISASREWAIEQGNPEKWKDYWQQDDTRLLHFIGKDNIVFHCLIFPAMLMANGDYVLPENVPANEFLNLEGRKLSTSRGWAVWLHEYLETLPPDLLRYAMGATLPEAKDADFSWDDYKNRVNSELADVLGNFVHRTLTFTHRYFDGVVPALSNPSEADLAALAEIKTFPDRIAAKYDTFKFREAISETMALARLGNKYFNDAAPWHSRKTDMEACGNTIHVSLQICASLAVLMDPVLPFATKKMRSMLALTNVRPSTPAENIPVDAISWNDAANPLMVAGDNLGAEPEVLFTKVDEKLIQAQIDKLHAASEALAAKEKPYAPAGGEIEFDDFVKLDLRAAKILSAEPVPKTKKLLKVQVDLGYEKRQILAGVAEHLSPDELIGQTVVVVSNLKPRKMRGLMSEGMILMAEDRSGKLIPVTTESEPGSVVR